MMGQLQEAQNSLFYDFCLEKHIPDNHLLRKINQFLDFTDIRQHLEPFYSHTGRPSIDPELMIRMLLVGYCYGIRSERRLCEEVNYNLAYRWFCQLGLEDTVPEHSTFSKNRHGRYRKSDLFRVVFEMIVSRCIDRGLVKGEGFAIDASLIDADAHYKRSVPGNEAVEAFEKELNTRAIREYIDALDNNEIIGRTPKQVSLTDPCSRYAFNRKGAANYSYSTNYLIDIEHNIIVDVEATPSNRLSELESTKTMIERVEKNYKITPQRLIGDTAYGCAELVGWIVDKGIAPHSPLWDKSKRKDDTYNNTDFTYDKTCDEYICPNNKRLRTTGKMTKANTILYRARNLDCKVCSKKHKCCPDYVHRKIARSIYEEARDIARQIATTPEYLQSRNDRKKVEVLFGHLKRILKFDRLRLRGLTGASDEFLLAATAQNLRRMAKIVSQPSLLTG